jgi:hypothetical protein
MDGDERGREWPARSIVWAAVRLARCLAGRLMGVYSPDMAPPVRRHDSHTLATILDWTSVARRLAVGKHRAQVGSAGQALTLCDPSPVAACVHRGALVIRVYLQVLARMVCVKSARIISSAFERRCPAPKGKDAPKRQKR